MSSEAQAATAAQAGSKKKSQQGSLLNLQQRDPFADVADFSGPLSGSGTSAVEEPRPEKIHIRCQQRNGRKMVTTVQGLDKSYDPKKILKAVKKEFGCNGHVVSAEEADAEAGTDAHKKLAAFGQIIQLQGDQRIKIRDFLVQSGMVGEKEAKEKIQIHGH